jgi:hypothetical protein
MILRKSLFKNVKTVSTESIGYGLLAVLVTSLSLSYALSVLLSSYFQINLTEALIFNVNDGWCNSSTQGIGAHCFGDFYTFMQSSLTSPWVEGSTAYPPFPILFFKVIKSLFIFSNSSHLALFIYLGMLTAALMFPVVHLYATRRMTSIRTCAVMVAILFTLAPTLMVLDRGNNIGFAVPLIYLCYLSTMRDDHKGFLIATTLLCMWKPQLGVLSMYFIFNRKFKWFFFWLVSTLTGYLVSFRFFGYWDISSNLKAFIRNLSGYEGYVAIPGYFPSNWSFANFVSVVIDLPGLFDDVQTIGLSGPGNLSSTSITFISGSFLIISLIVIQLRARTLNNLTILTLLCILAVSTPSVTFSYYLAVLIPFLVIISYGFLTANESQKVNFLPERTSIQRFILDIFSKKSQRTIFAGVIVTCFVNWPITWKIVGVASTNPVSKIGLVWTIGLVMIHTWYFAMLLKRK